MRKPSKKLPTMKLRDIAKEIDGYLKRFEANPKINRPVSAGDNMILHTFFRAGAYGAGRYVSVVYIAYQGSRSLPKQVAMKYLDALRDGYMGTHYGVV